MCHWDKNNLKLRKEGRKESIDGKKKKRKKFFKFFK